MNMFATNTHVRQITDDSDKAPNLRRSNSKISDNPPILDNVTNFALFYVFPEEKMFVKVLYVCIEF